MGRRLVLEAYPIFAPPDSRVLVFFFFFLETLADLPRNLDGSIQRTVPTSFSPKALAR